MEVQLQSFLTVNTRCRWTASLDSHFNTKETAPLRTWAGSTASTDAVEKLSSHSESYSSSPVIHPVTLSLNWLSYHGFQFVVILFPSCTNTLTGNATLAQKWKTHICANIWIADTSPGNCLRKTICEWEKYSQCNTNGESHTKRTPTVTNWHDGSLHTFWVCVTLWSSYTSCPVSSAVCTPETARKPFSRGLELRSFTKICPGHSCFQPRSHYFKDARQFRPPNLRYEQIFSVILQLPDDVSGGTVRRIFTVKSVKKF